MDHSVRSCGPCTACCTVMGVPELPKGNYETCTHLCGTGCGMYDERPASCRAFECQWLRGLLEVDGTVDTGLRPDSCGVIFEYQPDTAFGEVFKAWEVEPGAAAAGRAQSVIGELGEGFLVVVMTRGRSPRFVGPDHLVRLASDVMWSMKQDPGAER